MSNATNSVKSIADSTPKADNGSADVSDNPDFTSVENFTTAEADVSERNADS